MRKLIAILLISVFALAGCNSTENTVQELSDVLVEIPTEITDMDIADGQISESKEEPNTHDVPYSFQSEDDFTHAVISEAYDTEVIADIKEYFRPRKVPEDVSLVYILVKDSYIALRYNYSNATDESTGTEKYFLMEWYRTMNENDLAGNISRIYTMDQIETYNQYSIIKAGTLQDVFWTQDGFVFHAVTPSDISPEQLENFCDAEKVSIN